MKFLDGPAPATDRAIYGALKARGVSETQVPAQFRDLPVMRSRKGPAGAIVVRRMSGVVDNSASRLLKRFESNVGGVDDIAEKLGAIPERLNAQEKVLLDLMKAKPSVRKSLSRMVAEAQAEPTQLMKKYAEGCIELGKVEAAIEAHRNLPALVKNLYKTALQEFGVCGACGGTGALHRKSSDHKESIPCSFCKATGMEGPSKMKEFATRQLLEITKQVRGEGGVTTNVAVGVKVGSDGTGVSIFEKMMKASDEVLFRRAPAAEVVEAEVVPQEEP